MFNVLMLSVILLIVVKLGVIVLNLVKLNVVMVNVIMLSVVTLNVVPPEKQLKWLCSLNLSKRSIKFLKYFEQGTLSERKDSVQLAT
jgi:hypothetical protein